jgi:hypothetical protein
MKTDIEKVLWFGKHKGTKIKDLLKQDPSYLIWMNKEMDTIDLPKDFMRRVKRENKEQRLGREEEERAMYFEDYPYWE